MLILKKEEKKLQTVTFYVVFMGEGKGGKSGGKQCLSRCYFINCLINSCSRLIVKLHCARLPAAGSLQTAGVIEKVTVKYPVEIQKVFTGS